MSRHARRQMSMVAGRDVQEGEVLLTIPQSLWITAEVAAEEMPPHTGREPQGGGAAHHSPLHSVPPWHTRAGEHPGGHGGVAAAGEGKAGPVNIQVAMVAWLLREKARGRQSEWWPYIDILPPYVPLPSRFRNDSLDEAQSDLLKLLVRAVPCRVALRAVLPWRG
ncbi:unnamed protein product [Closterium sp. NIES-53]